MNGVQYSWYTVEKLVDRNWERCTILSFPNWDEAHTFFKEVCAKYPHRRHRICSHTVLTIR